MHTYAYIWMHLCYSVKRHPWVASIKEVISLWFKVLPDVLECCGVLDVRGTWSKAKQDILRFRFDKYYSASINKVKGLLGNVISTLQSLGWNPIAFDCWEDPQGVQWILKHSGVFPVHLIVQALQRCAILQLWEKAASHTNGNGMQQGVSYNNTMKYVNHLKKVKDHAKAAACEVVLSAGCWSPFKKWKAGLVTQDAAVCTKCGAQQCDDFHQFWACESHINDTADDIVNSQQYVSQAQAEIDVYPCLWLRGVLPESLVTIPSRFNPKEDTPTRIYLYGIPSCAWAPGTYGTDAAGGKFGQYPELRRCGCGVSAVSRINDQFEFSFGASRALPGEVQTIPRAELFAILMVVEFVSHGCVTIITDSLVNVLLYESGRDAMASSSNFDLWNTILSTIECTKIGGYPGVGPVAP